MWEECMTMNINLRDLGQETEKVASSVKTKLYYQIQLKPSKEPSSYKLKKVNVQR